MNYRVSLPIVLSFVLVLSSCSMPQMQVRAPYRVKERVSLGFQKAVIYELSDSLSSFAKQRYLPYYRFDLLNERGVVIQQYVGAFQEYLSRVAGSLRPEQKLLIQSTLKSNEVVDSTTHMSSWSYPNYEGEVSDLGQNGTIIHTRYWSIDSVGTEKPAELFTTRAVSVPYQQNSLQLQRNAADFKRIRTEADEYVYYDFKRFVLSRFSNQ